MTDFFDDWTQDGLIRDEKGRPVLVPSGAPLEIRVPYTRASMLPEYLRHPYAIQRWNERMLARGLGMRPDLAALAAAETYTTGFGKPDKDSNRASGRRLDAVIERAKDAALTHERADYGTAVHLLTEPENQGSVPERMQADVDSFWRILKAAGCKILATELFVACDELMTAGTFDHILWVPGMGYVIADKKTGDLDPHDFAIQLSVYANGELYDVYADARSPLPFKVRRDLAIVIHIPAGQGKTELHVLDIATGYQAAKQAAWVRDWPQVQGLLGKPLDIGSLAETAYAEAYHALDSARSRDELEAVWFLYENIWDDSLTAKAKIQLEELR